MKLANYQIIKSFVATEKSMTAEADNTYTFKVANGVDKLQIKKAVSEIFNVNVIAVRKLKVRGKKKRFKNRLGTTKSWTKAIVKLKENDSIDFSSFE